ncbi:hypothetical protein LP422_08390 [Janibacter limosus]|uniref:Uncharacterized protein n=1 Tax=Janibacter limosus TaxID=53458 RepID=A0AC61U7L2_9MICO|nr:hypothetical protein [Janibacter limosus]UUZ45888.1 hypothetical protein LP422_08390 [Janibacter limosus]
MSPYFQPTHHTPSVLDPTPQGSPFASSSSGPGRSVWPPPSDSPAGVSR